MIPPLRQIKEAEPDGTRIILWLVCGHTRAFTPHTPYEQIRDALLRSSFPCVECGRVGEGGE